MNRKRAGQWVVAAVIVAVSVAAVWLLPRTYNRWRVNRAVARFEACPSQEQANRLSYLLDDGVPTQKQGERILRLIWASELTVRRAYPADRVPIVSVECRFRLDLRYAKITREAHVLVAGTEDNSHDDK